MTKLLDSVKCCDDYVIMSDVTMCIKYSVFSICTTVYYRWTSLLISFQWKTCFYFHSVPQSMNRLCFMDFKIKRYLWFSYETHNNPWNVIHEFIMKSLLILNFIANVNQWKSDEIFYENAVIHSNVFHITFPEISMKNYREFYLIRLWNSYEYTIIVMNVYF